MKFLGYERPDGSIGIRNYVLVIPGGFLAANFAKSPATQPNSHSVLSLSMPVICRDAPGGRLTRRLYAGKLFCADGKYLIL